MALPAVAAVAGLGSQVWIAGPGWVGELYRGLGAAIPGRGKMPVADLAVLFKPSFSAAWAARRSTRRVGLGTDHRGWLLTERVVPGSGHRMEDFAAVARAAGAAVSGLPRFVPTAVEIPELPPRAVLLLPGTASPATVRWPGFRALADALGERAVFAGGPADMAYIGEIAGPHRVLPALSIDEFAAVAVAAERVVGNDSGLSHLAAAARRGSGREPAEVVVVYGSTDPARTGPPGSTAVPGPRPDCWPCYKKSCGIGTPCLGVGVREVLERIRPGVDR